MNSLENKVVLITGASSGIGEACARIFAQGGAKLILNARRQDSLEKLAKELNEKYGSECQLLPFDVRDRSSVELNVRSLPASWSNIEVLINNAGLSRGLDPLQDGKIEDWEEMIDTNIKGLLYMTRHITPKMIEQGSGHVINIGSIAGHDTYPKGNVYCATKAAVRTLSEGLKQDLLGTPVRVSCIDPGLVQTEFSLVRFRGEQEKAEKTYQGLTPLSPEDVADVIYFCATRPPHVNISEMLVIPTDQSGSTMVHRNSES
ncbi:SDR family oxidoreductase [Euhalothece natronophila Z-M001]|uniref:SDR family oxidoreductase n=1 Tax=Euhalothece natronophila Z-M001 TaxID=522448 RepID=A0A5B8NMN0_9CHRO|nr:SDR family oxidoreductase [Euhalothece natronophila]QDZ40563.1 SDR family oxidoreductase [Euhalothece natronophila Z-M001]